MKSPLNRGGLRFYLVAVALAVGTLLCQATTPRSILAGLPLLCAGVCLHTWAKGCLRQNRVVAMIGPYRFVRHPFYLANALIDAGLVVMAGWLPLAIALPFWWLPIYIGVIRGEERYLFPGAARCLMRARVFAGTIPTSPAAKSFHGRCESWPIRCCSSWPRGCAAADWIGSKRAGT
jgi:hypothetical protein